MNQLTRSILLHYYFAFFSIQLKPDKTSSELADLLRTGASFCEQKQKIKSQGFAKADFFRTNDEGLKSWMMWQTWWTGQDRTGPAMVECNPNLVLVFSSYCILLTQSQWLMSKDTRDWTQTVPSVCAILGWWTNESTTKNLLTQLPGNYLTYAT